MSVIVFLDSGPLSLLAQPKKSAETIAITQWALAMMTAGHIFMVPSVADYEVR